MRAWRACDEDRDIPGERAMSVDEITPLIGPNSIDVGLGRNILVLSDSDDLVTLDPRDPSTMPSWSRICMADEGYVLSPGDIALGVTNIRCDCSSDVLLSASESDWDAHIRNNDSRAPVSRVVHHYEGRSTVGRMFLSTHITAAFGDYGYAGYWTLEMKNEARYPIRLIPGMRIGQYYFEPVIGPSVYQGAYPQPVCLPGMPSLGRGRF
jgi:dCTP deaminase